jgi:beta-lactamase superfamily II metal-dependent hydrolase
MMVLRIFDVEHGACAIIAGPNNSLAMIDCGHNSTTGWRPSSYLKNELKAQSLNYLLITNVDQDHISDLATLIDSGIAIGHLMSNTLVSPQTMRIIKEMGGALTDDAQAYLRMRTGFGTPGTGTPFSQAMGGVTVDVFNHAYPAFIDTNNLSCAYFITYGPFKILFPGDLEKEGWLAHLKNPAFVRQLQATTVLVASHHGRESGYCEEIFEYCKPQAVVISDKSIVHDTQNTGNKYRSKTGMGIKTSNGGIVDRRFLLTTRSDGDILFKVDAQGNYTVTTGV